MPAPRRRDRALGAPGRQRQDHARVILDEADLAQAVELSVQSAFFSTGQRCIASSRLVVGGERLQCATEGFYMAPALLTDSISRMRIKREEVFGPVASIIRVKGLCG